MTKDQLIARFSWQFKEGPRLDGCVPPGWYLVLAELMAQVEALLPADERDAFWWTDIKEKRGELRAYCVTPQEHSARIDALIDEAEQRVLSLQSARAD